MRNQRGRWKIAAVGKNTLPRNDMQTSFPIVAPMGVPIQGMASTGSATGQTEISLALPSIPKGFENP